MTINFLTGKINIVYTERNKTLPAYISLCLISLQRRRNEDLFLILLNSVCTVSEESEHSTRMSAINLKNNSQNDASNFLKDLIPGFLSLHKCHVKFLKK